ncbi:MAG TPA: TPM domain-containing protein [Pyrinomonadaceae bacterium]|nr:TPM domain-containing protein [Pyrinomonadaceae bacterium]
MTNLSNRVSKKNYRALILSALLALVCVAHVFVSASAQDKLPAPSGNINDFAEVLDPATKQRLDTVLQSLKTRTDVDLIVAVVKTAGSADMYDYSLRIANDWQVGTRASTRKTLLMVIAADTGQFFTQFSRAAQTTLPDGLVGEMGRRMRPKFEARDFSGGLVTGVQAFVNGLGEQHNFTFAQLDVPADDVAVAQTRPRTVESPPPADTPAPQPSGLPSPENVPSPTPTATPTETPSGTPVPEATPTPQATATPAESPTPSPAMTETPVAEPSAMPAASPIESPAETPAASPPPSESPSPSSVAKNTPTRPARPTRSPVPPADPEDELEEVELTLTKPLAERIELLKTFIATHPKSVAVRRANELIVSARASLGDQKLQAGDVRGGLQQFQLAMSEAPTDMSDRLFTEVIARIPMNLFLRGQREAAYEAARRVEALAKLNPTRLLAVTQFYLGIEDVKEANRLAELTVQNAPEVASAHQALGAARHIALRLEDAEAEYAKALALNPKLASAKLSLADLKRASAKSEEALVLYREVLEADPKNNPARAGAVVSLLESGKQEEAVLELNATLQDPEKARNLPLLVGAAYWFMARGNPGRALDLAQRAVALEPRYSWAQIAYARALVADKRPLDAERVLRFAQNYSRFPTLDYELANVLASVGLYDEAAAQLAKSFSLKDGQIETKLAGRLPVKAANFSELLAPERRAAIFQNKTADSDANAKMLKALLTFTSALNAERRSPPEDELATLAQEFISGEDPMRTYRQVYVASKFLKKGVALSTVLDLMESATTGVEAALNVPGATVAVQAEELADMRARALSQGGTPSVPDAPRTALSGLLRGKMEDNAGLALFNLNKPDEAVLRFRRAVSTAPEGTPLWRSSLWHLGAALEADGKGDQALLFYIKSYVAGPDIARRSVIENLYKKINGTLDGLDDKIGGRSSSAGPTPTPSPSPW